MNHLRYKSWDDLPSRNRLPSLKLTVRTWEWMVGRLPSFWEGPFSGATVDGKNPAPLGMPQKVLIVRKIPTFWASWMVQDLFHQQCVSFRECILLGPNKPSEFDPGTLGMLHPNKVGGRKTTLEIWRMDTQKSWGISIGSTPPDSVTNPYTPLGRSNKNL